MKQNLMNTMKRSKPNKEVLLQYIYDYGIDGACNWWCITKDEIDKILNPEIKNAPKIRSLGSDDFEIDKTVAQIIEKNYKKLRDKYVNDDTRLTMCQDSEDIFHNTLIKVMEDLSALSEDQILEYIDYKFKMINFQIKQDQKELYKHQTKLSDAHN